MHVCFPVCLVSITNRLFSVHFNLHSKEPFFKLASLILVSYSPHNQNKALLYLIRVQEIMGKYCSHSSNVHGDRETGPIKINVVHFKSSWSTLSIKTNKKLTLGFVTKLPVERLNS